MNGQDTITHRRIYRCTSRLLHGKMYNLCTKSSKTKPLNQQNTAKNCPMRGTLQHPSITQNNTKYHWKLKTWGQFRNIMCDSIQLSFICWKSEKRLVGLNDSRRFGWGCRCVRFFWCLLWCDFITANKATKTEQDRNFISNSNEILEFKTITQRV